MHFAPDNGSYVYFRYDDQDSVMVVINKQPEPFELDLGRFAERLQGYNRGREVVSGQHYDLGESLVLPARSVMVLDLD